MLLLLTAVVVVVAVVIVVAAAVAVAVAVAAAVAGVVAVSFAVVCWCCCCPCAMCLGNIPEFMIHAPRAKRSLQQLCSSYEADGNLRQAQSCGHISCVPRDSVT